jgi:hypothetical protein
VRCVRGPHMATTSCGVRGRPGFVTRFFQTELPAAGIVAGVARRSHPLNGSGGGPASSREARCASAVGKACTPHDGGQRPIIMTKKVRKSKCLRAVAKKMQRQGLSLTQNDSAAMRRSQAAALISTRTHATCSSNSPEERPGAKLKGWEYPAGGRGEDLARCPISTDTTRLEL